MNAKKVPPTAPPNAPPRFPLLTAGLVSLLVLGAFVAAIVKLEQDHRRSLAVHYLQELGFGIDAGGESVRYVRSIPVLSGRDFTHLPELLSDWTSPHDLGVSPGLDLRLVDLRGSGAGEQIVKDLRERFPGATILH